MCKLSAQLNTHLLFITFVHLLPSSLDRRFMYFLMPRRRGIPRLASRAPTMPNYHDNAPQIINKHDDELTAHTQIVNICCSCSTSQHTNSGNTPSADWLLHSQYCQIPEKTTTTTTTAKSEMAKRGL